MKRTMNAVAFVAAVLACLSGLGVPVIAGSPWYLFMAIWAMFHTLGELI